MSERQDAVDGFEIRIEVTEEIARALLWQVLTPEAIVMQGALNKAIAQQEELLGISTEGRQVASISVTVENGVMYAEIGYTAAQA